MSSDLTSPGTMSAASTRAAGTGLELDDIQRGVLHQRPSPYVGTYLLLRIGSRQAGRKLVQRLYPVIEAAQGASSPAPDASIAVAFTYQGLKALGVPQDSLDSFAPEFRQGMAARAAHLGDTGDSGPGNWEKPLGRPEVHVAVSVLAPDAAQLEGLAERARRAHDELPGVEVIWRQDVYQLPTGRTSFGFKDGIGQPAVEGSAIPGSNPDEPPVKAGEFILGYPDETGSVGPMPAPEVLGRNGTYLVFRKLHTRVAAYRQYLRARAASARKKRCSRPRWSAAGKAAPRSRCAPTKTIPVWAPTLAGTTTSATAMTCAASNARPARTRGEPTPATRSIMR